MNSAEQEAFAQLQQAADKSDAQHQLSGWVVRTGRQGVYYLHENSSLSFQTLGAARVAVHALKQSETTGIDNDNQEDDEDEDRIEVLSLCCCLDGVIGQLHKQVKALESNQQQPQRSADASWVVQSKIVDMYDVYTCICAYGQSKIETDTGRHPVAEINQAALSTLAGHLCSLCPKAFAQIQLHIRIQTTLHVNSVARAQTQWCSITCTGYAC